MTAALKGLELKSIEFTSEIIDNIIEEGLEKYPYSDTDHKYFFEVYDENQQFSLTFDYHMMQRPLDRRGFNKDLLINFFQNVYLKPDQYSFFIITKLAETILIVRTPQGKFYTFDSHPSLGVTNAYAVYLNGEGETGIESLAKFLDLRFPYIDGDIEVAANTIEFNYMWEKR